MKSTELVGGVVLGSPECNSSASFVNKGWKFLKKLWCFVGGDNKVIWLYQLSWKCKLATVTSYKADVSSVSPSSERLTCMLGRCWSTMTVCSILFLMWYKPCFIHIKSVRKVMTNEYNFYWNIFGIWILKPVFQLPTPLPLSQKFTCYPPP